MKVRYKTKVFPARVHQAGGTSNQYFEYVADKKQEFCCKDLQEQWEDECFSLLDNRVCVQVCGAPFLFEETSRVTMVARQKTSSFVETIYEEQLP